MRTDTPQLSGRRKYWSELKADEKIERTREVVKQQGETQTRLLRELSQLKEEFTSHYHKEDRLCQDIKKHSGFFGGDTCVGAKSPIQNPDEVYF